MAEAIVRGMLEACVCNPEQIHVADINEQRVAYFQDQFGVTGEIDSRVVVSQADVLVLAVKPQVMGEVLSDIHDVVPQSALVMSIAAGISISFIRQGLREQQRILRAMPNTPCLVQQGVSAIAAGPHATEADLRLAETCLQATGLVVRVEEGSLDAVTALSGSGPAYYFYFVQSMLQAADELGLSPDVASLLAYGTMRGAAAMLETTGEAAEELRRRVTSKGGTTEAALESMRCDRVGEAIRKALHAAYQRSRDLSQD